MMILLTQLGAQTCKQRSDKTTQNIERKERLYENIRRYGIGLTMIEYQIPSPLTICKSYCCLPTNFAFFYKL
jgi:hypothetical protein